MSSDEDSAPMIYYSLIAFNTKIICEVNEYNDDTNDGTIDIKKEKKYIRACKKILKKIEQYELRRPDGMGTLISGTYSYNYIHGYEYCNNTNYPLLESLIFLCVLPLYQSNPNVTSNEREIAFNFLSSIRRDFLTSFAENLRYIYQHEYVENIAVRINNNDNDQYINQLSIEDENISTNLHKLSHIMIQRMHGNYKNEFDYTSNITTNDGDDINIDNNNNNNHTITGEDEEEESEYINIKTPASKSVSNTTNRSNTDSFIGVSMENSQQDISTNTATTNTQDKGPGYGSIANSMNIDDTTSHKSRINAFVESIVDVKQQMKDKISSMSVSSLRSFGTNTAMSDDKFVDYETMPLIGSTTSILGGEYQNDYTTSATGFVTRHRKKIAIVAAILLIIYIIISIFCGWNFEQCAAK